MSDDLDRRLRDGPNQVPPPSAVRTPDAAAQGLKLKPVAFRAVRHLPGLGPLTVIVAAAVVATVTLMAGADGNPLALTESSTSSGATALETIGTSVELEASEGGLVLQVAFDSAAVAPGAGVSIDVMIHNGRSVPVVLMVDRCGTPATMEVMLPLPLDPTGRMWDGIADDFKRFALANGYREGGLPIAAPSPVRATAEDCRVGSESELSLEPGKTTGVSLLWTANLVENVPALPGESCDQGICRT